MNNKLKLQIIKQFVQTNWPSKIIKTSNKSSSVNTKDLWDTINPELIKYAFAIAFGFDSEMIVTSGVDSVHSKGSVHTKGMAIDIRVRSESFDECKTYSVAWWEKLEHACRIFANVLGMGYSVVLEKDHIHLQLTQENIKNPKKEDNLWISNTKRFYVN